MCTGIFVCIGGNARKISWNPKNLKPPLNILRRPANDSQCQMSSRCRNGRIRAHSAAIDVQTHTAVKASLWDESRGNAKHQGRKNRLANITGSVCTAHTPYIATAADVQSRRWENLRPAVASGNIAVKLQTATQKWEAWLAIDGR